MEWVGGRQPSTSLIGEGLELGRRAVDVDGEHVVFTLLDGASVDELTHKVGGNLVSLGLLLHGVELLLELVNHLQLGLNVCLLLRLRFLLRLDLGQSPSAFGADLEHVGRHSFGD